MSDNKIPSQATAKDHSQVDDKRGAEIVEHEAANGKLETPFDEDDETVIHLAGLRLYLIILGLSLSILLMALVRRRLSFSHLLLCTYKSP